jgi:hypothetical protein
MSVKTVFLFRKLPANRISAANQDAGGDNGFNIYAGRHAH